MGLALLAPWSTKLPLATTSMGQAYVQSPMLLYMAGMCGMLSLWVMAQDGWLGALAAWFSLMLLWHPHGMEFESVVMLVFGGVALVLLRDLSAAQRDRLLRWLVYGGMGQVAVLLLQWAGWDLTWQGLVPLGISDGSVPKPAGTFGNKDYLGMYLAMLTPLAPRWALPVLGLGTVLTTSVGAVLALTVGLMLRVPAHRGAITLAGLFGVAGMALLHKGFWFTVFMRLDLWWASLASLTPLTVLIGHGPASWLHDVGTFPIHQWTQLEGFAAMAHNEVVQLFYEGGLVAVTCLAGWLWAHRALWRSPYAGGVGALAVVALTLFPFHLVTTGMVALVVLAGATTTQGGVTT